MNIYKKILAALMFIVVFSTAHTAFASVAVGATTAGGGQAITITDPYGGTYSAYLHLPSDYATSGKTYPLLVFLHGMGEAGTDLSMIYNNGYAGGPAYLVEHGQLPAMTNPADGKPYQFIVLAPQATYFSTHGAELNKLLQGFVPNYRVDTSRLYVTGLSAGGQGIVEYMVHQGWTNTYTAAAAVPMSEAWYYPSGSAQVIVNDKVFNWGFGSDPEDQFGILTHNLMNEMSAISPGMSRYTNYSGGHCCWNTFYDPNYKETINGTSMNIYQWMLQYVRGGSNPPTSQNQPPVANAGADRSITLPTNSVTLSGSGTDSDGSISSYAWSQVSGPSTATIGSAGSASTSVSNLVQGTYTFRLKVTDNQGSVGTDDVNVVVNAMNGPYGGIAWTIPGTIQAEDFDNGGEGVGYHDLYDNGNQGGQYRTSESVDIEKAADASGTYDVGWIATGEWLTYSVKVQTSGTYTLNARIAAPGAATGFTVSVDGAQVATVAVPQTGSYQTWQTVSVPNISLSAGAHALKITMLSYGFNINYFTFTASSTPANQPPSANAGADQTITLPINATTLSGSGTDSDGSISSYSWSEVSGPSTATIGSAGSASTSVSNLVQGTYTFRLKVTDNQGSVGTDDVNVVVNAALDTTTTATYNIDFGSSGNQTAGWNNITDPSNTTATTTLINSTGGTTTRRIQITDSFYPSTVNTNGTNASSLFPASATGDSFFLGTLNSATDTKAALSLSGLNNANLYDFRFYASRLAGDGANRITNYTIGSTTKTLNATDNINNYTDITNVAPTNGTIAITIEKSSSAIYGYLGVLQITEHGTSSTPANQPPSANAGADQTITLPINATTLSGSGTDSDGSISSYSWSEVSGPSTATIGSAGSASTSVSNLVQGTYTFRLKVTDNAGATATDDMNVVVNAALSSTSGAYGGTPWAIPGTIQAEDFDLGGQGVAYSDVDAVDYGGQYRVGDGVDIEKAYDTTGAYDVGWIATGEWLKYTINVQTTGNYTFGARIAAPGAATGFSVQMDGTTIATVAIPQTGSYQTWQTVSIPNISLTAGTHVMKILNNSNGYNLNYFTFSQVLGASVSATDGCLPGVAISRVTGAACTSIGHGVIVSASYVNVRKSPTTGTVLGKEKVGSIGTVLIESSTWPKVTFTDGLTGYVSKKYLKLYTKPY